MNYCVDLMSLGYWLSVNKSLLPPPLIIILSSRQERELNMEAQTLTRLPLEPYIGSKIIEACPMELDRYNSYYNKVVPSTEGNEGYVVFYPDDYVSWSPKSIFEEAYRKLNSSEISKVSYYK